jgi:hypothetical protein
MPKIKTTDPLEIIRRIGPPRKLLVSQSPDSVRVDEQTIVGAKGRHARVKRGFGGLQRLSSRQQ